MAELYSIVYTYNISLSTPLLMDIYIASLPLSIVNSAAVNTGVFGSFWIMGFSRYMPRSWITGS